MLVIGSSSGLTGSSMPQLFVGVTAEGPVVVGDFVDRDPLFFPFLPFLPAMDRFVAARLRLVVAARSMAQRSFVYETMPSLAPFSMGALGKGQYKNTNVTSLKFTYLSTNSCPSIRCLRMPENEYCHLQPMTNSTSSS